MRTAYLCILLVRPPHCGRTARSSTLRGAMPTRAALPAALGVRVALVGVGAGGG